MNDAYYSWLVSSVGGMPVDAELSLFNAWDNVLQQMYRTPFECDTRVPMDVNRLQDAAIMRDDMLKRCRPSEALSILQNCGPTPSFFEVLVALAKRMDIEGVGFYGPGHWFWSMMSMSGLINFNGNHYNPEAVNKAITVIMERRYAFDGSGGGLFIVPDPVHDLREIDIWMQSQWWLTAEYL